MNVEETRAKMTKHNKHKDWKVERKGGQPHTSGPGEQCSGEFPLSFPLPYITNKALEKSITKNCQQAQTKWYKKSLLPLIKVSRKVWPNWTYPLYSSQTQIEYTFSSSTHATFSKTYHIQSHKTNLNKLKS